MLRHIAVLAVLLLLLSGCGRRANVPPDPKSNKTGTPLTEPKKSKLKSEGVELDTYQPKSRSGGFLRLLRVI